MFAFNPGNEDQSGRILGQSVVGAAQTTADAQVKMVDDIGGALVSLANVYGKSRDKKDMLAGMDQSMGAMSDMGVLPKGFLNHYNQLDDNVRPFVFEAIASPMFKSYTAGQSAAAQAQAWDKYNRNQGAGGGGGDEQRGNNKYGYRFGG
jgi:hypothetical protein